MRNLHEKLCQTQKERDKLRAKLAKLITTQGVEIDSNTNADLSSIAQSEACQMKDSGSFQHILGTAG